MTPAIAGHARQDARACFNWRPHPLQPYPRNTAATYAPQRHAHTFCAGAEPLRRRDSAAPPHWSPGQAAHRLRLDAWNFPEPAAVRSDLCSEPSLSATLDSSPIFTAELPTPPPCSISGLGEHFKMPLFLLRVL